MVAICSAADDTHAILEVIQRSYHLKIWCEISKTGRPACTYLSDALCYFYIYPTTRFDKKVTQVVRYLSRLTHRSKQ